MLLSKDVSDSFMMVEDFKYGHQIFIGVNIYLGELSFQ